MHNKNYTITDKNYPHLYPQKIGKIKVSDVSDRASYAQGIN